MNAITKTTTNTTNDLVILDEQFLATAVGGDFAGTYARDVRSATHDTLQRGRRAVAAAQRGDWGTAAVQSGATVINGIHTAGVALAPVGEVVGRIFDHAMSRGGHGASVPIPE